MSDSIRVLRAKTFAARWVNDLRVKMANPELYRPWRSGLRDWDRIVGGVGKGWYIVIVAQLKGGKTGFMNTMQTALAEQKVSFVSVSLEMNYEQMGWRVFANLTGIDMTVFRDLKVTDNDWIKIDAAQKKIGEWDGYYNYGAGTIESIRKIVKQIKPQVVFIDYLGLTHTEEQMNSRNMELGKISRELKIIASGEQEVDQLEQRQQQLLTLEGLRNYTESQEEYEKIMDSLRYKWASEDEAAGRIDRLDVGTTIITAQQTSKEMIRAGMHGKILDSTAPKDSNAPFEDCDLGITINPVLGPDDKPMANMRNISVAVSRVSETGEFTVKYNGATATFYDDTTKIDAGVSWLDR